MSNPNMEQIQQTTSMSLHLCGGFGETRKMTHEDNAVYLNHINEINWRLNLRDGHIVINVASQVVAGTNFRFLIEEVITDDIDKPTNRRYYALIHRPLPHTGRPTELYAYGPVESEPDETPNDEPETKQDD